MGDVERGRGQGRQASVTSQSAAGSILSVVKLQVRNTCILTRGLTTCREGEIPFRREGRTDPTKIATDHPEVQAERAAIHVEGGGAAFYRPETAIGKGRAKERDERRDGTRKETRIRYT